MTTTDSFPSDFLLVLAIGGALSGTAWILAQRFSRQSRWWRPVVCLLVGATLAPTCIPVWNSWVVAPAIVVMPALMFDGWKHTLLGLLYGALPILLVATVIFMAWAASDSRRRKRGGSKLS